MKDQPTPSQPQPFIKLSVRVAEEDYNQLNLTPITGTTEASPIIIPAMADTGCQSCLIGYKWIQRLHLNRRDLIPAKMKMNAANNRSIKILGAVVLHISGTSKTGEPRETKQFTYVTNDSDKFYISKSACIDLGMISEDFPSVGETAAAINRQPETTTHRPPPTPLPVRSESDSTNREKPEATEQQPTTPPVEPTAPTETLAPHSQTLRRSTRERRQPARFNDFVLN